VDAGQAGSCAHLRCHRAGQGLSASELGHTKRLVDVLPALWSRWLGVRRRSVLADPSTPLHEVQAAVGRYLKLRGMAARRLFPAAVRSREAALVREVTLVRARVGPSTMPRLSVDEFGGP